MHAFAFEQASHFEAFNFPFLQENELSRSTQHCQLSAGQNEKNFPTCLTKTTHGREKEKGIIETSPRNKLIHLCTSLFTVPDFQMIIHKPEATLRNK